MLPTDYNDGLVQDFTIKTQPTLTYRLRFDGRPAGGMLNGTEAMKQAVFLALQTERFRYAIYSWNYGVELEKLFGEGITPYLQARIRNAIEDALLADDRITQVDGFSFERTGREQLLLCKQAAKNFHTICKKETALKRVLSNLLSAVSLLRFKAVFSCGFRVPPGSGLYQSCAAGSVCIPAGQKYCSPRPRKSCPADRKTLGLPSRCIGHRW